MSFPTQLHIGNITFHIYGLIIGIAVVIGWRVAEYLFEKEKLVIKQLQLLVVLLVLGTLVGARAWHVLTDWHLYENNLVNIFYIWNGGLSILGALLGGAGILFATRTLFGLSKEQVRKLLDIFALVLPISQALGRLANWVNQELYGLPTNLPWGLWIDPANRVLGYESFSLFHPLFAYEAIGLLILATYLWGLYRKEQLRIGSGKLAVLYILGYTGLRFCLDFLRIDKVVVMNSFLGLNQIVLLVLFGLGMALSVKQWQKASSKWLLAVLVGVFCVLGITIRFVQLSPGVQQQAAVITQVPANQKLLRIQVGDLPMTVEIADTQAKITRGLSGRTEIGADGMLFVFAQPARPGFWMKEMHFDLDLVWIRDGTIVDITPNVPAPPKNTKEQQLAIYYPAEPVTMVLEVPAGFAQEQGWQIGTTLDLDSPGI